jgi:TPR repeat protein
MFWCGILISAAIGFYIIKSTYLDNARSSEQTKQHLDAAESGNVSSMVRVGVLYWHGYSTERNTPEAIRWWEKGAEHGSANAMVFLGSAYYSGYRTGRDWDKARRWLTVAVETDPEKAKDARMILDRIDKGLLPHQWSQ